jgi:hypothetical protein
MPGFHTVFSRLATLLVPLSIALTLYLYLYPFAHRCAFPSPPTESQTWLQNCAFEDETLKEFYKRSDLAPFRLLALGDPQLEGDTSLKFDVEKKFPGFKHFQQELLDKRWKDGLQSAIAGAEDLWREIFGQLRYVRKYLDLLGNDYYLAHIYRTLHWTTAPTHVTVLGDLLGSQWVDDEEFNDRANRFWNRVFKGADVVPGHLLRNYKEEEESTPGMHILGEDKIWKNSIINVVGNHDIGYAGDIVRSRIDRFERKFGPVNGDMRFMLPVQHCSGDISNGSIPTLRLVVLNSMNLDSPTFDGDLQQETFKFINSVIEHSEPVGTYETSTILLTHIPLHKEAGICVDAPYFSYFPEDNGGGIEEQNMISKDVSAQAILQGIFGKSPHAEHVPAQGMGRGGIILTGHDHEGCDVYHYVDREHGDWAANQYASDEAVKARHNEAVPGLREVTARSMMGEFGGYAALVSAWWDQQQGKWQIEVQMCSLGVQHIWWAIHILDLATIAVCLFARFTRTEGGTAKTSGAAAGLKPIVAVHNNRSKTPVNRGTTTASSTKKKSSASGRRMQESLEENRLDANSGSDTKQKKSASSSSKHSTKKPAVKLKQDR